VLKCPSLQVNMVMYVLSECKQLRKKTQVFWTHAVSLKVTASKYNCCHFI